MRAVIIEVTSAVNDTCDSRNCPDHRFKVGDIVSIEWNESQYEMMTIHDECVKRDQELRDGNG